MAGKHSIIVLVLTAVFVLSVFTPLNFVEPGSNAMIALKESTVTADDIGIKTQKQDTEKTPLPPRCAESSDTFSNTAQDHYKQFFNGWGGDMAVWTDDIESLMSYLASNNYKKPVGPVYKIGNLNLVFLKGDAKLFNDIQSQKWACGVEKYADPYLEDLQFQRKLLKTLRAVTTTTDDTSAQTSIQTPAELFELSPALYHGAHKAWEKGYTGKDVKVAIIDSGVDFASPDIQGTQARVTDVNSPYYGWPIAFDQLSMFTYLYGGDLNSTGIWYADTRITATEENNNLTLYHDLTVDGANDFWSFERFIYAQAPGTPIWNEIVGEDDVRNAPEILEPNLDVTDIYGTSNKTHWFFGIGTKASAWNMRFALYINSGIATPTPKAGGEFDPEGNYFKFPRGRPQQVLYIHYSGVNKTIERTNFYSWNSTTAKWDIINFTAMGGEIAIAPGEFIEIGFPKKCVDYAEKLGVMVATFGWNNPAKFIVHSPTDDIIATASSDHVIKLWHTGNQSLMRNLTGGVNTAAFSADGKLLAAPGWWDPAKEKSNMYIWYTSNGTLYTNWTVHGGEVKSLSFSPNGTWLVVGTSYKKIRIWNVTTGKEWTASVAGWFNNSLDDSTLPGKEPISHAGSVNSVAFSEDGFMIFSASDDKTIKAWNWSEVYDWQWNKRLVFKMRHGGEVTALKFSPDYSMIATSSADKTIRLWNLTGELRRILSHPAAKHKHTDVITSIDWSPNGKMLVSGSKDCTIRVWDVETGEEIVNFTAPQPIVGVAFSNDNERIFSVSDKEVPIRTWSIPLRAELEDDLFEGHWHKHTRPQDIVPTIMAAATILPDWSEIYVSTDISTPNAMEPVTFDIGGIEKKSVSGIYHIGYLPYDWMLTQRPETQYPAILVVDASTVNGLPVYDTVYIDMDNDKSFSDEKPLRKGSEIAYYDKDGDGYADYSGGMIYWIAQNYYDKDKKKWETPIPYSDVFVERYGKYTGVPELELKVPANGTLVCFMFDSNLFFIPPITIFSKLYLEQGGTTDGTAAASVIVGRNKTIYTSTLLRKDFKVVQGVAPDAKIIAVRRGLAGLEPLIFAVEGYDGIPGTGDEAQIVNYGYTVPFTQSTDVVAGWDITSRFMDYLANVYSKGSTIFVTASGDTGPGYGTINSPGGSRGVLTVGSATSIFSSYFVDNLGSGRGPFISYSDVAMTSSRGPTAMGWPKPDVIATGTWVFCSVPLYIPSPSNGKRANCFWYGSAAAAAVTSGLLALVYDAYKTKHGTYPTVDTITDLIKSTADDMHYDVLTQGSGFVNAYRAVKAAADEDGIVVSPSVWVPGKFRDTEYEGFAHLMFTEPGRNEETMQFKITNHAPNAVTVEIKPMIIKRFGTYSYELDLPSLPEDKWWRNIRDLIPEGTELLKITAHSADDAFWDMKKNPQHSLWTFDGTSSDIHPRFKAGDNVDEYGNELNRDFLYHTEMWTKYSMKKNIMEVRIHDPLDRTHNALWVFVKLIASPKVKWNITLDFYKKVEWDWITLDITNPVTINGHSSIGVNATITLPMDVPVGSYEGMIFIKDIRDIQQREQLFTDTESTKFVDETGAEVDYIEIVLTRVTNAMYTNMTTTKLRLPDKNIYPNTYEVRNASKYSVRDELVLNATGGETYAYLQNAPVLPWDFDVKKNGTSLIYGIDYTIDFETGNISFIQPLAPADNITASYIWRTKYYVMTEPANYTFDLAEGIIEFTTAIRADKDIILLNYSWSSEPYEYAQLAHKYIVKFKLFKNSTEMTTGYTIDYKTGIITFSPILNPLDRITTQYTYMDSIVAEFTHGYSNYSNYPKDFTQIVPGSVILYDINDAIVPETDYLACCFNGKIELQDWAHDKRMSITAEYKYSYNTVIPVLVNVATRNVKTAFAGSPKYNTDLLFSNYEFFGGYGGGAGSIDSVVDTGDWRYFFVDIPDTYTPTPDKKLYIDVKWNYSGSQASIYTIGSGAVSNDPSGVRADIYGSYTLVSLDSNKELVGREIAGKAAALEVKSGLTVIAVHNLMQNGTLQSLPGIEGTVGLLYDINPSEMTIYTNKLKGKQPLSFESTLTWPGVGAYAKGPASPIIELGLEIPLGGAIWPPHDAPVYVKKTIDLVDCLILDIWVYVQPDADIDICMHYDDDGDGIFDPEKDQCRWWSGWPTGYDEHIRVPPPGGWPKDGRYFLIINNFEAPGASSPVDLHITMVAGVGLSTDLPVKYPPYYFDNNTVPAYTKYKFNLKWNMEANDTTIHRPGPKPYGDGEYMGVLYFGPNYVPLSVYMPVTISFERGVPIPPSEPDFEDTDNGSKEGSYDDLRQPDDKYEILHESDVENINKLVHRWGIPLIEDGDRTLKIEAHVEKSNAPDDFEFYYSTDNTNWTYMFTIPSTQSTDKQINYIFEGGALYDTNYVWIKVEDTNRAPEDTSTQNIDSLYIDWLCIETTQFGIKPEIKRVDPAPGSIVTTPTPTIVCEYSEPKEQPDINAIRIEFDGIDVTPFASIEESTVIYSVKETKPLLEGVHSVKITFADLQGNTNWTSWSFLVKYTPPLLEVKEPAMPVVRTNTKTFTVKGITDPSAILHVYPDPTQVEVEETGAFSKVMNLTEGENKILIHAQDIYGNTVKIERTIIVDTKKPYLRITRPAGPVIYTCEEVFTLEGTIKDYDTGYVEPGVKVTVNDKDVYVHGNGNFSITIPLPVEGSNIITIVAKDRVNNTKTHTREIIRDTKPPVIDASAIARADGTVVISGVVTDENFEILKIDGMEKIPDEKGRFTHEKALSKVGKTHKIVIEAKDIAGNVVTKELSVVYPSPMPVLPLIIGVAVAIIVIVLVYVFWYKKKPLPPKPPKPPEKPPEKVEEKVEKKKEEMPPAPAPPPPPAAPPPPPAPPAPPPPAPEEEEWK